MIKVLITGGKGFIARNIYEKLHTKYDIYLTTRADFDLTDKEETAKYFSGKYFDVVIHTAIEGGKRLHDDSEKSFVNNVTMFYNLMENNTHFNRIINIGSGAELDKSKDVNETSALDVRFPTDYYGMSKNVIARVGRCWGEIYNRISPTEYKRFVNVRSFGIFGEDESLERFIRSSVVRCIRGKPIIVNGDKKMDFFYIDDFISVIDYVISEDNVPQCIDCCYEEFYTLRQIAEIIRDKIGSDTKIDMRNVTNTDYVGNRYYLPPQQIRLVGMKQGLQNICEKELAEWNK